MKIGPVERIYSLILLFIVAVIVVHAPLSVFFGSLLPDISLLIKSWKEALLLLALPFAIAIVIKRRLWRGLMNDLLFQLIAAYLLIHILIAAALLPGPLATIAGLAIDLRYIVFFILIYVLMKSAPRYRRNFLQAATVGAAVVIGFAALQLFLPADILSHIGYGDDTIQPYLTVDENRQFIRVNSTLRGPNPLGAYAVIVISLIAAIFASGRLKFERSRLSLSAGILAIASFIALWISYSRSALGAAVIANGIVVVVCTHSRVSRRAWVIGAVILFALIGGLVVGRDNAFVSNILFHENPAEGNATNSNDGHIESLVSGTERMLRQPIGAGVGSTGSASLLSESPFIIENQYLFIAHEVGWLGLALFLVLFAVILMRAWCNRRDWLSLGILASGLGLAAIGLVLPVWVDDTVSIVWWGLAAVALGTGGKHDRQPTK